MNLSAEELIDSPDTAVVEVTGVVPAGAPHRHHFGKILYRLAMVCYHH